MSGPTRDLPLWLADVPTTARHGEDNPLVGQYPERVHDGELTHAVLLLQRSQRREDAGYLAIGYRLAQDGSQLQVGGLRRVVADSHCGKLVPSCAVLTLG